MTNAMRKRITFNMIKPEFKSGSEDANDPMRGTIAAAIRREPSARQMTGKNFTRYFCIEAGGDGNREIIVNKNSSISAKDLIGFFSFICIIVSR